MTAARVILGPQRLRPTLRDAVGDAGAGGQLAAVTAGWEDREDDDRELTEHLGGRVTNLYLFQRCEDVLRRDGELLDAVLDRRERLRALRDVYRRRLRHALRAARELLRRDGDPAILDPEREDAIAAVRRLDAHHLHRVRDLQDEFDARMRPRERKYVARHAGEIAALAERCDALCVAGGHVGILLHRLRMFGVLDLFRDKPIFAWSAGAMALCEQIVLFHDSPPQGAGDAEVLGPGLGVLPGIVPLPHARRRLRLDDPVRVGLFVRRFGPALCPVLDDGVHLRLDDHGAGGRWNGASGAQRLAVDGTLQEVGAA